MVGVEVGQDDQGDAGDAQLAQAAVDRCRGGSGVHDDSGAGAGGEYGGVALADVFSVKFSALKLEAGRDPMGITAGPVH
ncbi:hypothetical protein GCM10017776_06840 [Streptomyces griseoluteus]|nr:hypothetical protein GCM10017776_06840 [Streptomyces griseoluteus]